MKKPRFKTTTKKPFKGMSKLTQEFKSRTTERSQKKSCSALWWDIASDGIEEATPRTHALCLSKSPASPPSSSVLLFLFYKSPATTRSGFRSLQLAFQGMAQIEMGCRQIHVSFFNNNFFFNSSKNCYAIVPLDTYVKKLIEINKETNIAHFFNFKNQ